ncbi:Ig-like domain-containing protein [Ramlibacter sp. MMS24-I3-19]|uniref:Ig-like domain-containing protein n=1 Tax=Ramlibacter sp. MMS24-I3-19 TaxID=3416606 RepID=UPI003CFDDF4C
MTITSPSNGAVLARGSSMTVRATASDNVGVKQVSFYLNGSLLCSVNQGPYSCAMRLPYSRRMTTNTVQVKAYDAAGNVGQSSIAVTTR